jgi:hypothetical protein
METSAWLQPEVSISLRNSLVSSVTEKILSC